MKVYNNILETIGKTPLVKLNALAKGLPAEVYLKLEFFNPLGSVKDRIGMNMIEAAEKSGKLKPGMKIIEPTSGNTGIALAMVCAAKGYSLTLTMPETASLERRTLLLLLGAELIITPAANGIKGAIAKALELTSADENAFYPSQFANPDNVDIHKRTTALEIWDDTDGKVDYIVAGVGTGGTITGVGEVLKAKNPNVKVIAVEPQESAVLSGGKPGPHKIQGIGTGFIPKILNVSVIDEIIQVSSEEAIKFGREVIKKEGIPVGISSGAAVYAAIQVAQRSENQNKKIVVIIPSYTERYLSTLLAEDERKYAQSLSPQAVSDEWLAKVT